MAVPFDLKRMATAGSPVPVVEGVLQSISRRIPVCRFGERNAGVCAGHDAITKSKLVRGSAGDGKEQPLAAPENTYRAPASRTASKSPWIVRLRCGSTIARAKA